MRLTASVHPFRSGSDDDSEDAVTERDSVELHAGIVVRGSAERTRQRAGSDRAALPSSRLPVALLTRSPYHSIPEAG